MRKEIPAYQKVYAQIRRDILDGNYKTGMLIPPEPELEKIFSISRTTIRKAIGMLAAEGYLQVRQGHGTEIVDISTTQKLNGITSIPESLSEKGYNVTIQGDFIEKIVPPKYVNDALMQDVGSEVYKVQQIQCANDAPIAIIVSFLTPNFVSGLENHSNKFVDLYQFLEKQYGIVLTKAIDNITAIRADFLDSQILKVPVIISQ
jgi:GntR family transcriptional regulator